MITIKRYEVADSHQWDAFVGDSKNGTFLFRRGYMDYHSDRFTDHSLLFFDERNCLIALLPGNEVNDGIKEYHSHQGLTYGGFILNPKNKAEEVLMLFDETIKYLKDAGFAQWHYKQMPTIYHRCPSQEDEYALWRNSATIECCLLSVSVPLQQTFNAPKVEGCRKRGKNKALENGYQVEETQDLELFWPIMVENLRQKYASAPIHTLQEMKLLQRRFPRQIRCFVVQKDGKPEAGAIVYLANEETVHLQYAHATEKGKKERTLDLLYLFLIEKFRDEGYHYFDFGTSNENHGQYLNTTLIANKEGFGARGIAYKTFCIPLKQATIGKL